MRAIQRRVQAQAVRVQSTSIKKHRADDDDQMTAQPATMAIRRQKGWMTFTSAVTRALLENI